jgi:hypothetical protein
MVSSEERYVVGLDVGTSKVAAIVGEARDDGSLDVIGVGLADSRGIRRGVVVNLEAAVESIKKALEERSHRRIEIDAAPGCRAYMNGLGPGRRRRRRQEPRDHARPRRRRQGGDAPPGDHPRPAADFCGRQDASAPIGDRLAPEVNVHRQRRHQPTQNLIACANRAGVHVMESTLASWPRRSVLDALEGEPASPRQTWQSNEIVIYSAARWAHRRRRGRRRSLVTTSLPAARTRRQAEKIKRRAAARSHRWRTGMSDGVVPVAAPRLMRRTLRSRSREEISTCC